MAVLVMLRRAAVVVGILMLLTAWLLAEGESIRLTAGIAAGLFTLAYSLWLFTGGPLSDDADPNPATAIGSSRTLYGMGFYALGMGLALSATLTPTFTHHMLFAAIATALLGAGFIQARRGR